MRLTINHHVHYRFSTPQSRVVQLLRMTPADDGSQTVIDWNIGVNCDARLRHAHDGYGNATTMLYIDGPIDAIELVVSGEVLTEDNKGRVKGTFESLPPLFFKRSTVLTAIDNVVREFAAQIPDNGLQGAYALSQLICKTVQLSEKRTPKSRTASEVLSLGRGSARDCTQALIAVARAADFPARLVSGHCLTNANASTRRTSHCWAEIHLEEHGWLAFDPSANCYPGENYVRVATGLDASDSTPLSGTRRGGGIEELDVDIRVKESQTQG